MGDRILVAVEQAWAETLGDRAVMGASWEECFGDSLDELQLLVRIEDALAVTLPADLIQPDHTPETLAQAVAAA